VRPRLRDSFLRRFRARGPSLTLADLDFPEVKERVLTVAPTPYSGRTVKMNATRSPNTAKRFFEITDSFPIPRFGYQIRCTMLAKLPTASPEAL
jgi:hypothetical protein